MVSRVAKRPIPIPAGVTCNVQNGVLTIKGKLGQLSHEIHPAVEVHVNESEKTLTLATVPGKEQGNQLAGTTRAVVHNMVHGVSQGFERKLVLVGVGYRAKAQGKELNLAVGYSHPVDLKMPEGITVETPTPTEIIIKGADKYTVGQVAANICAIRPVEPYKGKGVRYSDQIVILKEAKKK